MALATVLSMGAKIASHLESSVCAAVCTSPVLATLASV